MSKRGQTDADTKPFTVEEIRFTQPKDGRTFYAIKLAFALEGKTTIKSLAQDSPMWQDKITDIKMLGVRQKMKFTRDENGLQVKLPENNHLDLAFVLKVSRQ